MMKDVRNTLLERVSIRRYEREAISDETMQFIYDAIRNTPTSYNGQQFSVIDIDDQQYASVHGENENISIDKLPIAVDFYKQLLRNYA